MKHTMTDDIKHLLDDFAKKLEAKGYPSPGAFMIISSNWVQNYALGIGYLGADPNWPTLQSSIYWAKGETPLELVRDADKWIDDAPVLQNYKDANEFYGATMIEEEGSV